MSLFASPFLAFNMNPFSHYKQTKLYPAANDVESLKSQTKQSEYCLTTLSSILSSAALTNLSKSGFIFVHTLTMSKYPVEAYDYFSILSPFASVLHWSTQVLSIYKKNASLHFIHWLEFWISMISHLYSHFLILHGAVPSVSAA